MIDVRRPPDNSRLWLAAVLRSSWLCENGALEVKALRRGGGSWAEHAVSSQLGERTPQSRGKFNSSMLELAVLGGRKKGLDRAILSGLCYYKNGSVKRSYEGPRRVDLS
jgi:hypothetical protein